MHRERRFIGGMAGPVQPLDRPELCSLCRALVLARALVLVIVLRAGNDIAAGKPAVEVDVLAAGRAERADGLRHGLAADRAAALGLRWRGRWRHGLDMGSRRRFV